MGKASSRKKPHLGSVVFASSGPNHKDDPDIARAVIRAYEAYREAADITAAFADAIGDKDTSKALGDLTHYLRRLQDSFFKVAEEARISLMVPLALRGISGHGADGSKVAIDLDGVVQHSAPLEVLRSLGVAPKIAHAKRGRKGPVQ